MCPINQAVAEGFCLVGSTQVAAEIKDCIVITQGQGFQKTFQFLKAFADFLWIGFVGFGIGLVELIENGFSIAVPGIKGMVACVAFNASAKDRKITPPKKFV